MKKFDPAFDTPRNFDEVVQVLEAWSSPSTSTFSCIKAAEMVKVLKAPILKEKKHSREVMLKAIQEASTLAAEACAAHLKEMGGQDQYPCGFAWVNIKPARGPWITLMKDLNLGHQDSYAGGWSIWNPGGYKGQNMDVKEAGARAFAAHLRTFGLNINVCTRID